MPANHVDLVPNRVSDNHPLAGRMALISFIHLNITIACIWGSFSVLLPGVEARLGIGREYSTLAVPLVNLVTAACAPIVGLLADRYSIRWVMLGGACCSVAGFLVLAGTVSYPLYLFAFALLLGPGMAAGAILPATLVTRWYTVNRGRTLGIINAPLIVAFVPMATNWTFEAHGLGGSYAMLAALSGIAAIACLFVVDRPPEERGGASHDNHPGAGSGDALAGPTMSMLLRNPGFWALSMAFIASVSGSIIITAHMVPMAQEWGLSGTTAASLLTIQSLAGMAGTILFGWIADRLGGVLAFAILLLDAAILWALLLLQPPFPATALLVGLIGLHGAGAVPVLGVALSEKFGQESFSRAFGLVNLVNLPFSVLAVPVAALVFARSGSYSGAIIGEAVFLVAGGLFILGLRRVGSTKKMQQDIAPQVSPKEPQR